MKKEVAEALFAKCEETVQVSKDSSIALVPMPLYKALISALKGNDARLAEAVRALEDIKHWCDAYPLEVFEEVTDEQMDNVAYTLRQIGVSSERVHASWARHILKGVREIISPALARIKEGAE